MADASDSGSEVAARAAVLPSMQTAAQASAHEPRLLGSVCDHDVTTSYCGDGTRERRKLRFAALS
jgi:hypothetical protein